MSGSQIVAARAVAGAMPILAAAAVRASQVRDFPASDRSFDIRVLGFQLGSAVSTRAGRQGLVA